MIRYLRIRQRGEGASERQRLGSTYQLEMPVLVDENVLRLQVAVHYLLVEALLEAFDDLGCVEVCNSRLKLSFGFDQATQRPVLAVLEDKIKVL